MLHGDGGERSFLINFSIKLNITRWLNVRAALELRAREAAIDFPIMDGWNETFLFFTLAVCCAPINLTFDLRLWKMKRRGGNNEKPSQWCCHTWDVLRRHSRLIKNNFNHSTPYTWFTPWWFMTWKCNYPEVKRCKIQFPRAFLQHLAILSLKLWNSEAWLTSKLGKLSGAEAATGNYFTYSPL